MPTTVIHQPTGKRYVLLGTGFGAYQSQTPNWFFGDMIVDTDEGQHAMVCVCNRSGKIGWFYSSEVVVESIDGHYLDTVFQ